MTRTQEGRDFWSRRRAAVAAERLDEAEDRATREKAEEEERLAARPDSEILAELGLPAPEEMARCEEVQALLRAGVPQRLKTRALRRLWRLNPVLANVDGLVDYGEDFTDAATVIENLQTAYEVGRGMLKTLGADDAEAAAAQTGAPEEPELAAPAPAAGTAPGEDAGDAVADSPPPAAQERDAAARRAADTPAADTPAAADIAPPAAATHRMRFRFEAPA